MKMKWIVIPVVFLGIAGVTGKFFYEYVEKKESVAEYISNQSYNNINVSYESMKLTKLTGTEFVVNGVALSANNDISASAQSALVDLDSIGSGKSTFSNVDFNIGSLSGNAGIVKVNELTISETDKVIDIELNNVNLKGKHEIAQGASILVKINQSMNAVSIDLSSTTLAGDEFRVVYKGNIDTKVKTDNFYDLVLNSELKNIDIKFKNVSIFNTATKEVEWLKPTINDFALKFYKHHYPKSIRTGKKLLDFLKDLDKIEISASSDKDVVLKLKDADKLINVDNMNIFSKLNLEVQ